MFDEDEMGIGGCLAAMEASGWVRGQKYLLVQCVGTSCTSRERERVREKESEESRHN